MKSSWSNLLKGIFEGRTPLVELLKNLAGTLQHRTLCRAHVGAEARGRTYEEAEWRIFRVG
jgi:hypothetical protein